MRLAPGQVVTGDDFFDRTALLERVRRCLPQQSVELVAPRRFGKSSIMRRLVDEPPPGCTVHFLDCEDMSHPSAFVNAVAKILLDQHMGPRMRRGLRRLGHDVRALGRRVEGLEVGWDGVRVDLSVPDSPTWSDAIDELLAGVKRSGSPIIVVTDEFSMMLENFVRAQLSPTIIVNLLSWFRRLRTTRGMDPPVAFVIGGSMSLEYWLRRLNATATMNDLHRETVEAFDRPTAERFATELLTNEALDFSAEVPARLLYHVDPHVPYWIQILVWFLAQRSVSKQPLTSGDVDEVYQDQVLGNAGRQYFQPYDERLARDDLDVLRGTHAVLAALASVSYGDSLGLDLLAATFVRSSGIDNAATFDRVFADLRSEFYLEYDPETSQCRFAFKVLRDWWIRWHPLSSQPSNDNVPSITMGDE